MSTLPGVDAAPRDASRSQWYTPPELAERIVEWAFRDMHPRSVLEPSCGDGALLGPIESRTAPYDGFVLGIDIDESNIATCARRFADSHVGLALGDFLVATPCLGFEPFELAIMNPPFENGQTESHILRALKWAERVVCHCPLTTLEGKARKASLWSRVSLPRMVIHSTRPKYGPKGGATAMCTVEVVPELQDGCRTAIEWW